MRTLTIRPVGAHLTVTSASERLEGNVSYFLGSNPGRWRTRLPRFHRVVFSNAYPGIDLAVYGRESGPEYDFVVRPGADPSVIDLAFEGATGLSIDPTGDLILATPGGQVRQLRPLIYQGEGATRATIEGRYLLRAGGRIGFEIGRYDASKPLVIDPQVVYLLAGATGKAIAADAVGNAYVAWVSSSAEMSDQVAVTKRDPQGGFLSSYIIGGSNIDSPWGIGVDSTGSVTVTGRTVSPDFPVTLGVLDPDYSGGVEGFVARLSPTGDLTYSTFLGGTSYDEAFALALDDEGNAYVTGTTASLDFPTTGTGYQPIKTTSISYANAFLSVLNPTATALLYSTYFGGTEGTIHAWVDDEAQGIAFDFLTRDVFVTGYSDSYNFPTTPGVIRPQNSGPDYDCFVSRFRPSENGAASLVYSTMLGGHGFEACYGIALDGQSNAYIAASRAESDFFPPGTTVYGSGNAAVAKLNATATEVRYGHRVASGNFQTAVAGIAVADQKPYISGLVCNASCQLFIKVLNAAGSAVSGDYVLSNHGGAAIAVDAQRNVYVTGSATIKIQWEGPSPIRVLSTTKRWKPQRSDDPINVDFEGPEDVDVSTPTSGLLEIQGPVGMIPFVGEIWPTSTSPPFTYRMEWTGPWTYTDPEDQQVKRLPSANYPIEVLVTIGSPPNQQQVRSATYNEVSLVEVSSIEFLNADGGPALDSNPVANGGGIRIFSEAQAEPTPSDPEPIPFQKPRVRIRTSPPVYETDPDKQVVVHLQAFDVDDPLGAPIDDEEPCLPSGCDNAVAPGAYAAQKTGGFSETGVGPVWLWQTAKELSVSGGPATIFFGTSIRQGDNYRVAASTHEPWLADLAPVQPDTLGSLGHVSEALTEGVQVTRLLTVWRTLHVESLAIASVAPSVDQERLQHNGWYTFLSDTLLSDPSGTLYAPEHGTGHDQDDGWYGADISLAIHTHPNCKHDVTASTETSLVSVGLLPPSSGSRVGQYLVRDDVIDSLNDVVDGSLAEQVMARACIKVEPEAPLDPLTFDVEAYRNVFDPGDFPSVRKSASTRWSVVLVGGFEGEDDSDGDPHVHDNQPLPQMENHETGATNFSVDQNLVRRLKAGIWLEAIRDLSAKPPPYMLVPGSPNYWIPYTLTTDLIRRTTAHELLHAMGLAHDGAMMCYYHLFREGDPLGEAITDAQVNALRDVAYPVKGDPDIACGPFVP